MHDKVDWKAINQLQMCAYSVFVFAPTLDMGRVTLLALILTLDLKVSSGQAFQIDEGLDRQVKVGTVLEKPWAYYDDEGTLKGYAIDIAQRQVSRLPYYTNFFKWTSKTTFYNDQPRYKINKWFKKSFNN